MSSRGLIGSVVILLIRILKGLIELVCEFGLKFKGEMLAAEIRTLRAPRAAATASEGSKSPSPRLAGMAEAMRARKKQRARKDKLKRAILDEARMWYCDYGGCDTKGKGISKERTAVSEPKESLTCNWSTSHETVKEENSTVDHSEVEAMLYRQHSHPGSGRGSGMSTQATFAPLIELRVSTRIAKECLVYRM